MRIPHLLSLTLLLCIQDKKLAKYILILAMAAIWNTDPTWRSISHSNLLPTHLNYIILIDCPCPDTSFRFYWREWMQAHAYHTCITQISIFLSYSLFFFWQIVSIHMLPRKILLTFLVLCSEKRSTSYQVYETSIF